MVTEKEAREALLLKVQYMVINHDLAPVNEAIDALLAARTARIVESIRDSACIGPVNHTEVRTLQSEATRIERSFSR